MSNHDDLIRRLLDWCGGQPGLAFEAADAIKQLVADLEEIKADRVEILLDRIALLEARNQLEADLAAARKALSRAVYDDVTRCPDDVFHAQIASDMAARAEKEGK